MFRILTSLETLAGNYDITFSIIKMILRQKYIDVTVVKDVVNKTLLFWQVLRKTLGIKKG